MRLLKQLTSSFLLILSGCAGMKVADFHGYVTLPYSEDGYGVSVVTKQKVRVPAAQWATMEKSAIHILPDDYKLLRKTIQDNCQVLQCKQLVGQFDQLFQVIDKNLQLIPWN